MRYRKRKPPRRRVMMSESEMFKGCPAAAVVWAVLQSKAKAAKRNHLYLSNADLCELTGYCDRTITRATNRLNTGHWIRKNRTRGETTKGSGTWFSVLEFILLKNKVIAKRAINKTNSVQNRHPCPTGFTKKAINKSKSSQNGHLCDVDSLKRGGGSVQPTTANAVSVRRTPQPPTMTELIAQDHKRKQDGIERMAAEALAQPVQSSGSCNHGDTVPIQYPPDAYGYEHTVYPVDVKPPPPIRSKTRRIDRLRMAYCEN